MSSIKLQGVCLDYVIKTGSESIKKSVIHIVNKCFRPSKQNLNLIKHSSYRALKNIDLEINTGDRIGVLGRNGAGKSTFLRVLAKVYKPSLGVVDIKGRVSNLFDVNLGMNIEATGYENIINLSIMKGISKKDAKKMVGDIEEFTELHTFLDRPVRTYSAGMQLKLAFAVATSNAYEIMLIDEIIGAGDSHFMEKATKRLEDRMESSHILVLTSHSNEIIKRFCNKTIVLDQGEMKFFGSVDEGIDFYQKLD